MTVGSGIYPKYETEIFDKFPSMFFLSVVRFWRGGRDQDGAQLFIYSIIKKAYGMSESMAITAVWPNLEELEEVTKEQAVAGIYHLSTVFIYSFSSSFLHFHFHFSSHRRWIGKSRRFRQIEGTRLQSAPIERIRDYHRLFHCRLSTKTPARNSEPTRSVRFASTVPTPWKSISTIRR